MRHRKRPQPGNPAAASVTKTGKRKATAESKDNKDGSPALGKCLCFRLFLDRQANKPPHYRRQAGHCNRHP
ncbi:hypothetical protein MAPG_08176 [Magnaporthiopsis poae ATCC 64411]|uniref:Uncharacterized protein n=1 Tax=Magnaporthiopsis poae (strain ATCC 64411 / 73-15) TaxID=644358 RepID=A0A0C4E6N2_MAGP6|nr:hypothetical protein MAPG_08176 [Magnaporthiopsis poae ATCC 64411]